MRLVRCPTMTVSSGPSSWTQTGRINWPRVGSSTEDWPAIRYMLASSAGRVGGPLAEALLAGPLGREHAAQAAVPGRALLGHLVRFWNAVRLSAST